MSIPRPSLETAKAFGASTEPESLPGGQNTTWRAGSVVLKPADGSALDDWVAETFSHLASNTQVRVPRPVPSSTGQWVHGGFVAWTVLEGEHAPGARYEEKLRASRAFHALLQPVARPAFLEKPTSSWAPADAIVWQSVGRRPYDAIRGRYDTRFMALIDQVLTHITPVDAPFQLVHGDMCGNFLVHPTLPPAIIDFSPAWAPAGFAEGIMLADAIVYENTAPKALRPFDEVPGIGPFVWRGILRRIIEQAEHITWYDKDAGVAVAEASRYQRALDYARRRFS
jgi:uncharacterized protein (TIGR02569 family)